VQYTGRKWQDLDNHDQVDIIKRALQADTFLIDPHSDYMRYWDLVIASALLFTGVVTPYEVIFMKTTQPDSWLFIINRLVDLIFVKDMIMQFFLKVEVRLSGKYGLATLKDPSAIRKRYLSSWFPIDAISVLPFDIFFLTIDDAASVSGIKILRCIRLLRLIKLVRILRTSRLILRWQNRFAISFSTQKLAKFTFILILSSHWLACVWGMAGIYFGEELCDSDGNQIFFDDEIPLQGVSWYTTLFLGGKHSPDDPCVAWHVYVASLHWSVMTITSIGYGDIVPMRNEEYLCCVLCMLTGGVLWAWIIGSTCGIIANIDPAEGEFEANTDLLNVMMREAGVEEDRRRNYREYLREAKVYTTMGRFRSVAQRFSPQLKGELLLNVSSQWTKKVWYLKHAPERLVMDLCDVLEINFFSKREPLQELFEYLCVVERGTVCSAGIILTPGSTFNVDIIISDQTLRKNQRTLSLTYSLVLALHRDKFFECVSKYPVTERKVARAAMKIALSRCIVLCAEKMRHTEFSFERAEWPSLLDVFAAREKDNNSSAGVSSEEDEKDAAPVPVILRQQSMIGGTLSAASAVAMPSLMRARTNGLLEAATRTHSNGASGHGGSVSSANLIPALDGNVSLPQLPLHPSNQPIIMSNQGQGRAPLRSLPPWAFDQQARLDGLEAALAASAAAAQNQLHEVQRQIQELRILRMEMAEDGVRI